MFKTIPRIQREDSKSCESLVLPCAFPGISMTFSVWKVLVLMTWWCNDLKEVKQNIVWNIARFPEFHIHCIIDLKT